MSSAFTRQPRVVKGAFLALDAYLRVCHDRVFVFQYNPTTLTRTIAHPERSADPSDQTPEDARHGEHAPIETITLQLDLDATDRLERPDHQRPTVEHGLHPALATLESMMQPTIPEGDHARPILLFRWGPHRSIPVQVSRLDITEDAFDPQLNPIRATVTVHLQVLQKPPRPGAGSEHPLWKNHRRRKAALARLYRQSPRIHRYLKELARDRRRLAETDDERTRR